MNEFFSRYKNLGLKGTPASTEEVRVLEERLGVSLPEAYKAFLGILGKDGGTDFVGSDCTIADVPYLREASQELLRECGVSFQLPENAVVFLMHQGYFFAYFIADGDNEDPPVFAYEEGERQCSLRASSFSEWLQL